MRAIARRFGAIGVATPTVLLTVFVVGYVVLLRAVGWAPGGPAASVAAFVPYETLWGFVLMPAWLFASSLWIVWSGGEYARLRDGSEQAWFRRSSRDGLGELALVFVPVVIGSVIVAVTSTSGSERATAWFGVLPRAVLLVLLLIAVRATLAAVFSLTHGSWRWMVFVAAITWLLGVATAGGRPLTASTDALSWLVWLQPERAAELTGFSWIGLLIVGLWLLITHVVLAVRTHGFQGAFAQIVRQPIGIVLTAILLGQIAILATLASLGETLSWEEAMGLEYFGAQQDQVGVPVLSFFLSLPIYLGAPFLLVRQLEDEGGTWRELTLLRSGTHSTWVAGHLTHWLRFAVLALGVAALVSLAAWLLLPDTARNPTFTPENAALLVTRFAVLGLLQVSLYVVITFAVTWLSNSTTTGFFTVTAFAFLGVANPFLGGLLPAYLNSLSLAVAGWEGVVRDALVLGAWAVVTVIAIIIAVRIRDRSSSKGALHARNRG